MTHVTLTLDSAPDDPTSVRVTLSAYDGDIGIFGDVPAQWLRERLDALAPKPERAPSRAWLSTETGRESSARRWWTQWWRR